jgi:hypothetical protein
MEDVVDALQGTLDSGAVPYVALDELGPGRWRCIRASMSLLDETVDNAD